MWFGVWYSTVVACEFSLRLGSLNRKGLSSAPQVITQETDWDFQGNERVCVSMCVCGHTAQQRDGEDLPLVGLQRGRVVLGDVI